MICRYKIVKCSIVTGFCNLQTNTFQMVLATDEVFTYAIFNYLEINWSSHTEAGGDTTTGEGGVPAYVSLTEHQNTFNIIDNINKPSIIMSVWGNISDWIQRWKCNSKLRIQAVLPGICTS